MTSWNVVISYSRRDDETLWGEEAGWITRFSHDLGVAMKLFTGNQQVKIWIDALLTGMTVFEDEIDRVMASSWLFIPILSPSYVEDESGWLLRERSTFIKGAEASGGLRRGTSSRICPVVLQRGDWSRLPREITEINIKHIFCDLNSRPLDGEKYKTALWKLAGELARALNTLRQPMEDAAGASTL